MYSIVTSEQKCIQYLRDIVDPCNGLSSCFKCQQKLSHRLYFRACGEEEQLFHCVKISHNLWLRNLKTVQNYSLPFISVSQFVVRYSETILPSGKCRQCEGIKCMVFVVHLYS